MHLSVLMFLTSLVLPQAHRTNLAVQTLSDLPVVGRIEDMLQTLYAFFAHSPKRHLEFVKLAELMQAKGLKIWKNVKTRWISMLSPAVRVLNEGAIGATGEDVTRFSATSTRQHGEEGEGRQEVYGIGS